MINKYSTPCFIFDRNEFENNICMFKNTLSKYFENRWILGYSFKTNYLLYLLRCVRDYNCFAEVVSEKEYNLAKAIGFNVNKIIYNGPVKTRESFLEACLSGAIVNIDSIREIEWLQEFPNDRSLNVGVRVNFELEKVLPGHTLMGEEGGRFGFCYENGELHKAIEMINEKRNVSIRYLHMHISSKTKSTEIYKEITKKACEIIDAERIDVEYIDVGGSFFGGGDDGSAYEKYIRTIKDVLIDQRKEYLGLVVEPGASVVASSFSYLFEVVDKKIINHRKFIVTDGSRIHIDPFLVKSGYSYEVISDGMIDEGTQVVVGFTCMEKDRIMKIEKGKEMSRGDRILINNVGSYSMCMNSDFISSEPRVYANYAGSTYLVKKEKTVDMYFVNEAMEEIS